MAIYPDATTNAAIGYYISASTTHFVELPPRIPTFGFTLPMQSAYYYLQVGLWKHIRDGKVSVTPLESGCPVEVTVQYNGFPTNTSFIDRSRWFYGTHILFLPTSVLRQGAYVLAVNAVGPAVNSRCPFYITATDNFGFAVLRPGTPIADAATPFFRGAKTLSPLLH